MSDRELLQRAHAARQAGLFEEALALYAEAAQRLPEDAEAQSAHGLMLLRRGELAAAEAPLRRAVALAPHHPGVRMNLAEFEAATGDTDAAVATVQAVASGMPGAWWAWERLGELHARERRFAEAETAFGAALQLRPGDPSLLYKWARAGFDCGHIDEAERRLRQAARLAPGHPAVRELFVAIHQARADWAALEHLARDWIALEPSAVPAWRLLAKAQWEDARLHAAMASSRRALELGGDDATGLATHGRLCLRALDLVAAAAALDAAEARDPAHPAMLAGKATLAMFRGQVELALQYCRRTLAQDPRDASAYKLLVQLSRGWLEDAELQALRSLASGAELASDDRIGAYYALGDCLDARGDVAGAFAAYGEANRLGVRRARDAGRAYDPARRESEVDELIATFDTPPASSHDPDVPRVLFVVGMPRSGTTLVESLLAAHSAVHACGERGEMRWIVQDYLRRARARDPGLRQPAQRDAWRQAYLATLPELGGARAVTDKNPWNFDALALILWLFPEARIVHVAREPFETCLSCYCNDFNRFVGFTNRFEDLAHYYVQYQRLVAHWERLLPRRFLTLSYEVLATDPQSGARALLDFCGLEWQPACASPARGAGAVATLSSVQVRDPLVGARRRAARFAPYTAPLVAALAAQGVASQSG